MSGGSAIARVDPIGLAQDLIRCPSVTPEDAGALDVLQGSLESLGFVCTRLPFSEPGTPDVDNLFAKWGAGAPHLCFAGHTDVVPVGDPAAWSADPFAAEIRDGFLIGRGATDMKGAIAAFVSAVSRLHEQRSGQLNGAVSFLITGDEEGPAINGTKKMLAWLKAQGERIDHCLVGEPTNPKILGDMIKIGRRGSLNTIIRVEGVQGHVAYPHLASNPVPPLLQMVSALLSRQLDRGNAHFQASHLEVTSVDVGNMSTNVIPAQATARFNIRFNDEHKGKDLCDWIEQTCRPIAKAAGVDVAFEFDQTGDAFVTAPGTFSDLISSAIKAKYGTAPELSTSGGTSDARFIKDFCPVTEFGLIGATMHKVDECVAVSDINDLSDIYFDILDGYFAI